MAYVSVELASGLTLLDTEIVSPGPTFSISCDLPVFSVSNFHRRVSSSWLRNDCSSSRDYYTLSPSKPMGESENLFSRIPSQVSVCIWLDQVPIHKRFSEAAGGYPGWLEPKSCDTMKLMSWEQGADGSLKGKSNSAWLQKGREMCLPYVLEKSPATTASENNEEERFQVYGIQRSRNQSSGNRFEASLKWSSLTSWCLCAHFQ